MKKILDQSKNVLFVGNADEMKMAFDYLTKPFYILAEKKGLKMRDAYELNAKYWNEKTKKAKSFSLIDA
jgi:hypothetical protein